MFTNFFACGAKPRENLSVIIVLGTPLYYCGPYIIQRIFPRRKRRSVAFVYKGLEIGCKLFFLMEIHTQIKIQNLLRDPTR